MRTRIAVAVGVLCLGMTGAARQQPALKEIVRSDLSIPGREVIQMLIELPAAGASGGKHTHPGEELVYLIEGSVRFEIDGQPSVVKNSGEAIVLPTGRPHYAANVGTGPARAVTTYIVEKGQPRTTFVK